MIKLSSLKNQKKETELGGASRPTLKRSSAAQLRITKGTDLMRARSRTSSVID